MPGPESGRHYNFSLQEPGCGLSVTFEPLEVINFNPVVLSCPKLGVPRIGGGSCMNNINMFATFRSEMKSLFEDFSFSGIQAAVNINSLCQCLNFDCIKSINPQIQFL